MRSKFLVLSILLVILGMNMISAEIMFSQPKAVYSIGDFLEISATVKANQNMDGFVTLSIACNGNKREFYLSPISLTAGQQELISKKLLVSKSFLGDMVGSCSIYAEAGPESGSSQGFQISDSVNSAIDISPTSVNPSEKIVIKGTAVKANSQVLEGFIEIGIGGNEIIRDVSHGKFEANFSFPENTRSGNYEVSVKIYDKMGEVIGNYYSESDTIKVKQLPTKLEIVADRQNVKPGETLTLRMIVYDQAGDEISGDVKLDVKSDSGIVFYSSLLRTNENAEISFPENATPGYLSAEASFLGLGATRPVYIEEVMKAKFDILNDTLTVTNVGNVPYSKEINVMIGDQIENISVNLGVGGIAPYRLTAPDGNYDIRVDDGSENLTMSGVHLLGGVIGVQEVMSNINLFARYPIVWIFLILVFGLFVVMIYGKVKKTRNYGSSEARKGTGAGKMAGVEEKGFEIINRHSKEAEHSSVGSGKKEQASVLTLKIKSFSKSGGNAPENIEKAVESITRGKGSVYRNSNDSITGVFTPSMTKSFRNDLIAIKVASEIAAHLNEHNRKFNQKIDFGIGVHSGDISARMDNGKLQFTALGNTLGMAKRIADSANNDVLLSKEVGSKVSSEVKTEKSGEYYSVKKMVDREQHKNFIDGFLRRN
jgi:hypothetical protein